MAIYLCELCVYLFLNLVLKTSQCSTPDKYKWKVAKLVRDGMKELPLVFGQMTPLLKVSIILSASCAV